jgi:PTS system nitrogen regulatory IIA component
MHFGASLRLLRNEAGLSLKELGQAVGVSPAYLSRVENGHDAPPTVDRIRSIAETFGVPVDLLLDLTARPRADAPDTLAGRALLAEVRRRRLGPAQVARVLAFIAREFPETASAREGVRDLLDPGRVLLGVRVGRLADAVELAALRLVPEDHAGALAAALNARERATPSAVGEGLLLPHDPGFAPAPTGALVLLHTPIAAPSPDAAPIRAILAVVGIGRGPAALSVLARTARLADATVIAQLCAATTPGDVLRDLEGVG